jgi:hypothetical protein
MIGGLDIVCMVKYFINAASVNTLYREVTS